MTINYSCVFDNERNSRLPFGVPLEDIFPRNDIHPYLKTVFIKAYKDITSQGYSIEQVISKTQGSIAERLILKEIVVTCKSMPTVVPPGALLWILRHFIGLLPLPLLPEYTDQRYFSWRRLVRFCRKSFVKYSTVEINTRLLTQKLAEELLRLPSSNLLLVSVLLNFIRHISTQQNNTKQKQRINRLTAFYLVRYFSSSIFIRPFTPGRNAKIDRYYFPLLFYLVLKWPDIENYFNTDVKSRCTTQKQFVDHSFASILPQKIKVKDNYAQTDYFESKSLETLSEITESQEEIDFLRDTGCQTEYFCEKPKLYKYCCCSYGRNYESSFNGVETIDKSSQYGRKNIIQKNNVDKFSQTNSLEKISTTKDVSTSYNDFLNNNFYARSQEKYKNSSLRHDVGTVTDNFPYCGWVSPRLSPKTPNKLDLSSPKTFLSCNDYIYDDYAGSTLTLLGNIEETSSKDDESDIMKKISKIGWTYTPPKSRHSPLISPTTLSKTGLKEENYTLYYNDKEQANTDEEKEKCSSCDSLKSKGSSVGKVAPAKSKKSFSVANIKNKLDFLKLFNNKKNKLKNSCSFDEISNIKYKKMNSTKSTLF